MKTILIYPDGKPARRVQVSDKLYRVLCIYKIFWPPETTIRIKNKVIMPKEYNPWPPPEQVGLGIDVPQMQEKRNTDFG